jgi:thioredoxin 1
MKLKTITDTEFETEVLQSNLLTLVFFHADWSYACRMVDLSLQAVSELHEINVRIVTMDVNQCPSAVRELDILRIPSIIYYFNGIDLRRDEGLMSVHFIESRIEELLKKFRGEFLEKRPRVTSSIKP